MKPRICNLGFCFVLFVGGGGCVHVCVSMFCFVLFFFEGELAPPFKKSLTPSLFIAKENKFLLHLYPAPQIYKVYIWPQTFCMGPIKPDLLFDNCF